MPSDNRCRETPGPSRISPRTATSGTRAVSLSWRVEPRGRIFLSGRSAQKAKPLSGAGAAMRETGDPGDDTAEQDTTEQGVTEQRTDAEDSARSVAEELVRRYQDGETLTDLVE